MLISFIGSYGVVLIVVIVVGVDLTLRALSALTSLIAADCCCGIALIAAVTVGDGEAETGPLATSWQSNKFLNPINDGAVLPILHLNGYKIANPTLFARMSHEEIVDFFHGCGWEPYFVEGDDPMTMHKLMAETMDTVIEKIKEIQVL